MASIEKTASGRWRAPYRDLNGRTRSRTFDTKQEARRFLDVTSTEQQRGNWVDLSFPRCDGH